MFERGVAAWFMLHVPSTVSKFISLVWCFVVSILQREQMEHGGRWNSLLRIIQGKSVLHNGPPIRMQFPWF